LDLRSKGTDRVGFTLRRIAIVFDTDQEGLQREKALNTRVQKTKKIRTKPTKRYF
jgi:hypothetical protein